MVDWLILPLYEQISRRESRYITKKTDDLPDESITSLKLFNDDNSSLSWTVIFGPTVHLCPAGSIVISKAAGTQFILQHSALR